MEDSRFTVSDTDPLLDEELFWPCHSSIQEQIRQRPSQRLPGPAPNDDDRV
jgi:hypothetical protein